MILRTPPTVYGKDLSSAIGAPQDYTLNKSNNTFPESYDLRIAGSERVVENVEMQAHA